MSTETRQAIESILMVAEQPVEPTVLAQLLETPRAEIEALCTELAAEYEAAGRGFILARVAGGYRFQSHPDLAPYVERFVLDGQSSRLSSAALETLAIVAYKQPISRMQIAAIRGVNVDGVLRTLQQRGYVDEVSRDPGPGNAVLFGTTDLFLERVGLDSTADLPPLAEFVPGADVVEALEDGLRPDPVEVPAAAAASEDTVDTADESADADQTADDAASTEQVDGVAEVDVEAAAGDTAPTDQVEESAEAAEPGQAGDVEDVDTIQVEESAEAAEPGQAGDVEDADTDQVEESAEAAEPGQVGDVEDVDTDQVEESAEAAEPGQVGDGEADQAGGVDADAAAVEGESVEADTDAAAEGGDTAAAQAGADGDSDPGPDPAPEAGDAHAGPIADEDAAADGELPDLSAADAAALLAESVVEVEAPPQVDLDGAGEMIDLVAAEEEAATVHRPTELQEELAALEALQHDVDAAEPAETGRDTWLPAESSVVATVRHDHDGDHAEAEPPAPPFRPAPGTGGAGTAAEAVAPGEDVGEADAAPPVNGGEPDGA